MKIYTKTGDSGSTSLFGGQRVSKGDLRIESYGTVDELNSYIGLLRDHCPGLEDRQRLLRIQNSLFVMGAMLATIDEKKSSAIPNLEEKEILFLEQEIDAINDLVPPMKFFILPGGDSAISHAHIARCICRRAERLVVRLQEMEEKVSPLVVMYLNRLSDYLFMLARKWHLDLGIDEIPWKA